MLYSEIEDAMNNELMHYGVPGMRKGIRKAPEGTMGPRKAAARRAGQDRVARAGGSKGKAALAVVGRTAAINVVTNLGGLALIKLSGNNPAVTAGTQVVAGLLQVGGTVAGVRDVARIVNSDKD